MTRHVALLLLAAACIPQHLVDAARDRDGDGYVAWQLGGPDCDDADASVHPGANEVCGDGIDNDCDGVIDDDGVGALTWYPDLDGDGFGVDAPVSACVQPERHVASLANGIDCDDTNAEIYPGAPDAWYDGVDSNCDSADDFDQDGDGYRSAEHHPDGDDCDDTNPDVNPGMEEICGNLLDDDCDGTHNECEWRGKLTLSDLRHAAIAISTSVADIGQVSLGDINEDGRDDLVIGRMTKGELWILKGPLEGNLITSIHHSNRITIRDPRSIFGMRPSLRDIDRDGRADLLVSNVDLVTTTPEGQTIEPVAYLFRDFDPNHITTEHVSHTWYPSADWEPPAEFADTGTNVVGDLEGDGIPYLLSTFAEEPIVLYLHKGLGIANTRVPLTARLTLTGSSIPPRMGPDLDGDGVRDLIWRGEDTLHWFSGSLTGTLDISEAALVPVLEQEDWLYGYICTLSVDGAEALVMAVSAQSDEQNVAHAEVWFTDGALPAVDTPTLTIAGTSESDYVIPPLVADLNGDGHDDLLLIRMQTNASTSQSDSTLLYFAGPLTPGAMTPDDATAEIDFGSMASIFMTFDRGDVDGDGFDDLAIGDLGYAYVLYGQGR